MGKRRESNGNCQECNSGAGKLKEREEENFKIQQKYIYTKKIGKRGEKSYMIGES